MMKIILSRKQNFPTFLLQLNIFRGIIEIN
jgi:hypothetical protein